MINQLSISLYFPLFLSISLNSALLSIIDFSENLIINEVNDKLLPLELARIKEQRFEKDKSAMHYVMHSTVVPFVTILLQQSCKIGSLYYTSPELLLSKTVFRLCTNACGILFEYLSENTIKSSYWEKQLYKDISCFFQDNLISTLSTRKYLYNNVFGDHFVIGFINLGTSLLRQSPQTYSGRFKYRSKISNVFWKDHFFLMNRKIKTRYYKTVAYYNSKQIKLLRVIYEILRQLLLPFKGWILWYLWQKYVYTKKVSEKVHKDKFFSYIYLLFQKEQTYLKQKLTVMN